MAFDFAKLDTATRSEAGVPFEVIDPRTGSPFRDDEGNPVTITLRGRNSEAYRAKQRQVQERRRDRAARGLKVTQELVDADDTEILSAVTVGWSFDTVDGQPFPSTPENIARLWADRRWFWVRERAIGFMLEDAHFLAT